MGGNPSARQVEDLEQEIRSIKRQYHALKSPIADFERLDPLSEPQGLRVGGIPEIVFPHEGILDAVLNLAQSVWHFKDYLKDAVPESQRRAIEVFVDQVDGLKVCADLANEKKHATLKRRRSKRTPVLGVMVDNRPLLGVVAFDTSKNGMVEFAYDGKTKAYRFWVSTPLPFLFRTEIIVSTQQGAESSGDAADFIFAAFKRWEDLMQSLGIKVRPDRVS